MHAEITPLGTWKPGPYAPAFAPSELVEAARAFRETVHVVRDPATGRLGVARGGDLRPEPSNGHATYPLVATLPGIWPEWLGDRAFTETHGLRFPYVTGAMANGIATPAIVVAMARAGMLGFLGSAGLTHRRIAEGLDAIEAGLRGTNLPYGANLIHSPNEPELEMGTVEMFLKRNVTKAEAAAYMALNPMVVRYAYSGIRRNPDGTIFRKNHLFAKISRPEVARRFMAPAPAEIVNGLVAKGFLTPEEAELAKKLPVAEDITVEADSGGHTDNRPLVCLLPSIVELRDEIQAAQRYDDPPRVGAAGGIGTPAAALAAFALGAAYVVTGSVNQSCLEAGTSEHSKALLARADMADVMMAPAADMFELGVRVQLLKKGTLFPMRAQKLYELYREHDGIAALPPAERERLERQLFRRDLDEVWRETAEYFRARDPAQVERAEGNPKRRMALVFRWYLGLSSRWSNLGQAGREMDYQIWCGPAMGAFNDWVRGSYLEPPAERRVVDVAWNVMQGAAYLWRLNALRAAGFAGAAAFARYEPEPPPAAPASPT